MNWATVQQMVRIAAQWLAGFLVSSGVIAESMATIVVGAAVSVAAVLWWVVWESNREDPTPPEV